MHIKTIINLGEAIGRGAKILSLRIRLPEIAFTFLGKLVPWTTEIVIIFILKFMVFSILSIQDTTFIARKLNYIALCLHI